MVWGEISSGSWNFSISVLGKRERGRCTSESRPKFTEPANEEGGSSEDQSGPVATPDSVVTSGSVTT